MRWLGSLRLRIIMMWTPILFAFVGCYPSSRMNTPSINSLPSQLTDTSLNDLSVLTWVGGLCILLGTISLVVPAFSTLKGGTALIIGVILILLNVALKEYSDWLYVPILIGTAAVTCAAAYKLVRFILLRRKKC
jgi:hypothetical protein